MARKLAHQVLSNVERDDAYSNVALDQQLKSADLSDRDRRLATELVYGVLTWRRSLDVILDDVVDGGIGRLDPPVLQVLRLGVYQLAFLDKIPPHAAVDESVKLVDAVGAGRARGLVNAVLRSLERDGHELEWWDDEDREQKPVRYLGQRYSLPNWIANRLLQLYGTDGGEKLAEAFTKRPPYYLRSFDGELEDLESVRAVDGVPGAWRTDSWTDEVGEAVDRGTAIVQDLGAQIVADLVGADAGDTVLDGCAGRGGKTLVLAEAVGPEGRVVAVDPSESKLDQLRASAEAAGLDGRIETVTAQLEAFAEASTDEFDAVLVDAPCSGLGTLRRHPEIRWNRDESDIPGLVDLQRGLLDAGASLVGPDGALVYAVCTLTREEGVKQVERLLDNRDDFARCPPSDTSGVDWSRFLDEGPDLTVDPVAHDTDLFYASRLQRT